MQQVVEILTEYLRKPFNYSGQADCCIFAGKLIEACGGKNYMESFSYTNKAEALRAIREHGTLVEAICSVMGEPQKVVSQKLEVGDLLIAKQQDGTWIPGVYLFGVMVVRTKGGYTDWPIEYASFMWRPEKCLKQ